MRSLLPRFETIVGSLGPGQSETPYLSRFIWGRLRVHVFHRGDADPDPHSHPWDFWTFPLVSYDEDVLDVETGSIRLNTVRAWRWHFRRAEYAHRVLWPSRLLGVRAKRIVTIVWTGRRSGAWGFYVSDRTIDWRRGSLRFVPWRNYVFGGER